MNARSIVAALGILFAVGLFAEDDAKPKPAKKDQPTSESKSEAKADPNESPLVRAAREAKAKREGEKSKISITNEDIEKTEGKLIQSSTKPLQPLPATSDVEKTMRDLSEAKNNKGKDGQVELEATVTKYQKQVTDLERELRRIEETYYNEDDPDYREDVLAKNFEETRKQLEAARKELAEARRALGSTGSN